jgi:hypothetical protein
MIKSPMLLLHDELQKTLQMIYFLFFGFSLGPCPFRQEAMPSSPPYPNRK